MQGPTLVESPSLTFHWPQELDWMILVPSNSDYSVILWFHNCNRWRWKFQTELNTRMCFMLCSVKTLRAKLSSLVALQSVSPSAQDLHWAEQRYLPNITLWLLCHFSCWGDVMGLWQLARIRDFRRDIKCVYVHLPPVWCPGDPAEPVSRGSGPRG